MPPTVEGVFWNCFSVPFCGAGSWSRVGAREREMMTTMVNRRCSSECYWSKELTSHILCNQC
jgi:hypothetical protein